MTVDQQIETGIERIELLNKIVDDLMEDEDLRRDRTFI